MLPQSMQHDLKFLFILFGVIYICFVRLPIETAQFVERIKARV